LVDTDYLDTEVYFKLEERIHRKQSIYLTDLWTKLEVDREKVIQAAEVSSVNQVRREVDRA